MARTSTRPSWKEIGLIALMLPILFVFTVFAAAMVLVWVAMIAAATNLLGLEISLALIAGLTTIIATAGGYFLTKEQERRRLEVEALRSTRLPIYERVRQVLARAIQTRSSSADFQELGDQLMLHASGAVLRFYAPIVHDIQHGNVTDETWEKFAKLVRALRRDIGLDTTNVDMPALRLILGPADATATSVPISAVEAPQQKAGAR